MPFVMFITHLIDLYFWVVLINVVLNWLLTLGALNSSNQLVRTVYSMTAVITEPVLRRVRNVVKPVNGIDFSPLVLLLGLSLLSSCIGYYLPPLLIPHGL